MKKKVFCIILVLICCMLVFVGCNRNKNHPQGVPQKPTQATDVFKLLDNIKTAEVSVIILNVTCRFEQETMKSEYSVKKEGNGYKVNYSVDQLNTFDGETIPEEYKSKVTGSMRIENGKIVEQNGAHVDIAPETLSVQGFSFDKANFADVVNNNGRFEAKVVKPSAFFGFSLDCQDLEISLSYTESAIKSITLTYETANGAHNTLEYILK